MLLKTLQTFTAQNGIRFSERPHHGITTKIIKFDSIDNSVDMIFDTGLTIHFDNKGKFLDCTEFPF